MANSKDKLIENGWKAMGNGGFTIDAHAIFPSQCSDGTVWSLSPTDRYWMFRGEHGSVQIALFDDAVKMALFIQGMFQEREKKGSP